MKSNCMRNKSGCEHTHIRVFAGWSLSVLFAVHICCREENDMISVLTENLESNEELDPQSAHLHCDGRTGLIGHSSTLTGYEGNIRGS